MGDVGKRVGPIQLTTSAVNMYGGVPAATVTTVRNIHVANTSGATALFFVSIGTTAIDTAASRYFDSIPVAAGDAFDWSGFLVLAVGEFLVAKAGTASALTFTASLIESS